MNAVYSARSYLTSQQVNQLLAGINTSRVSQRDGLSHLEAYDVRAHLNRIFGFSRWSADLTDLAVMYDEPTTTKAGKPGFSVGYRATVRLTVNAPDGTVLATYTEAATGGAIMPDFKRADAHDFAIKTAESQALKRCAINLGDQFGLSLYAKGSTAPLVKRTLHMPDGDVDTTGTVDHDAAPVTAEVTPDATSPVEAPAALPDVPPDVVAAQREAAAIEIREHVLQALDISSRQKALVALGRLKLNAAQAKALSVMTTSSAGEPMSLNVFIDQATKNVQQRVTS